MTSYFRFNTVQALYLINLDVISAKEFFADFTFTWPLEHHIKNVLKSTFGKLLKTDRGFKNRVSHLHGNEA